MTMPPQARVEGDLKAALKAGDKDRLSVLRLLLTEVKNERIRLRGEVDDAAFTALVRRAIKQREESSAQYRKGNRPDLATREESEAALLAAYLPAQLGEEQIRAALRELVAARGLSGPGALGAVMKESRQLFGGAADNATVSRIAREVLGGA
jgi:uncharacterized protein YqeY